MARHAFFSFHYQNDIWRAGQVRNAWVTRDRDTAGFWDAAAWEKVKRGGDDGVKRWIENQLDGTSVTVVLIGTQTVERKFVKYEISRSHELGKGLLGIRIHKLKDKDGQASPSGANPFEHFYIEERTRRTCLSEIYQVYDWVTDDGYNNVADWIERAAHAAGR